jgi:hypothetical protein
MDKDPKKVKKHYLKVQAGITMARAKLVEAYVLLANHSWYINTEEKDGDTLGLEIYEEGRKAEERFLTFAKRLVEEWEREAGLVVIKDLT